jgi:subtilisin family serine protease
MACTPLALVRVIELEDGTDVPTAVQQALAVPVSGMPTPNHLTYLAFEPNDPDYWTEQYGPQIIDAPTAWDITKGSSDIIICVADTGINYSHEDFQAGAHLYQPRRDPGNGIDDDGNGYVDDINGWGRHQRRRQQHRRAWAWQPCRRHRRRPLG